MESERQWNDLTKKFIDELQKAFNDIILSLGFFNLSTTLFRIFTKFIAKRMY